MTASLWSKSSTQQVKEVLDWLEDLQQATDDRNWC